MNDSDFEQRLQRAIKRGERRSDEKQRQAEKQALTQEELKQLHNQHRLQLSEHIERCVGRLPNYFPGFEMETIFGDRGWGAACSRDDIRLVRGRRDNDYSRLEMTIRPCTEYHVIDLAAKGTIRNKEIFNRNHFEKIVDVDVTTFVELIDVWVLEFAEMYAAKK
ncbi:MAG: hypothetical protein QGG36_25165 [Pirellulaceae bacterium]|nr:hypothetical protein [Pirellulaceae bacterium]MDP7019112.1 hypothetical protein [Pirellulaceae bacterium]